MEQPKQGLGLETVNPDMTKKGRVEGEVYRPNAAKWERDGNGCLTFSYEISQRETS